MVVGENKRSIMLRVCVSVCIMCVFYCCHAQPLRATETNEAMLNNIQSQPLQSQRFLNATKMTMQHKYSNIENITQCEIVMKSKNNSMFMVSLDKVSNCL